MTTNNQGKDQKESTFKEIFTCTCRKQYESFPALYLHNKTKHNITIHTRDKLKMKKKSVWSGNRKRIVYEFSSDVQLEQKTQSKENDSGKLRCSERFKNRNGPEQIENQQLRNIINQFLEFHKAQSGAPQLEQAVHDLFLLLTRFLLSKKFVQVLSEEELKRNFKSKIEVLPLFLNPFVTDYLASLNQHMLPWYCQLKVLQQFSKWLYDRKICQFMAVLNIPSNIK